MDKSNSNAKNGQFGEFLKNRILQSNSVTRQVNLIGQKLVEDDKIEDSNETFLVIFKPCAKVVANQIESKYKNHVLFTLVFFYCFAACLADEELQAEEESIEELRRKAEEERFRAQLEAQRREEERHREEERR